MTKEIWVNLPVKDVKKSKEFFSKIGFSFNEQQSGEHNACMVVGTKGIVIMLFAESMFKGFIGGGPVVDAKQGNGQVLISFDAESRAEIDELAKKVESAGGTLYGKPSDTEDGCMALDLSTLTVTAGTGSIWISVKCRNKGFYRKLQPA